MQTTAGTWLSFNSVSSSTVLILFGNTLSYKITEMWIFSSLVPRRSPPAHSTRLGAKCRDVTESFGNVTKFRANKDRQTAYSVILFCMDVCLTAQIRILKSGYFSRVNIL